MGRLGGKKGGPARAKHLSPRERAEIARNAVQTRWHGDANFHQMRQTKLPKLLMANFSGPEAHRLRLPRDLETVVMKILPEGTQAQKDWLCRRCSREAVVQIVRRWRGSFLNSKSQLHEWVSRSTTGRWARENPELCDWSQSR